MSKCMARVCARGRSASARAACAKDAEGHAAVTDLFGCSFFQDAQALACECVPRGAYSDDEL